MIVELKDENGRAFKQNAEVILEEMLGEIDFLLQEGVIIKEAERFRILKALEEIEKVINDMES